MVVPVGLGAHQVDAMSLIALLHAFTAEVSSGCRSVGPLDAKKARAVLVALTGSLRLGP